MICYDIRVRVLSQSTEPPPPPPPLPPPNRYSFMLMGWRFCGFSFNYTRRASVQAGARRAQTNKNKTYIYWSIIVHVYARARVCVSVCLCSLGGWTGELESSSSEMVLDDVDGAQFSVVVVVCRSMLCLQRLRASQTNAQHIHTLHYCQFGRVVVVVARRHGFCCVSRLHFRRVMRCARL